jgi:hypothetical protein
MSEDNKIYAVVMDNNNRPAETVPEEEMDDHSGIRDNFNNLVYNSPRI